MNSQSTSVSPEFPVCYDRLMFEAVAAAFVFLALAAAGLVWGVRRDDSRRRPGSAAPLVGVGDTVQGSGIAFGDYRCGGADCGEGD